MIDRAQDTMRAAPVVDQSGRVSSVGRLIVAASALVAAVVALVIVQRATSGPFLLGLLLILAAIGVIALLGGAIGLFGLAGRAQGQTMVRAVVDAAPEGVLVTDRDGRIIYANRAYADLMGAVNEREVRSIERLFAGDTSAAEAIYRLAQSVRDGRSAEEEVRLTTALSGDQSVPVGPAAVRAASPVPVGPTALHGSSPVPVEPTALHAASPVPVEPTALHASSPVPVGPAALHASSPVPVGPTALHASSGAARVRWFRIRARPLPAPTGAKALTAWTVADISQDRARQETVFQELQHAIDYLDHAPAGFFSAEPDGRIVYLNATLAEWLGIDLARFEAGSLSLNDIVRGDGVALLQAPPASGRRNRTEIIDLDLVKRNGQSLPVRLLHRVPVAADGAPGATRTLVLNRSPGEDVSEALRAAEVRFTRFFNNTPIAIAAIDRRGRIVRTNAPFLKLFGFAKGEFMAGRRRLIELVQEPDRDKLNEAIEAAISGTGEIPAVDVAIAGKGSRSARFYVNPVEDGVGDEEAAIVNALDITEQRTLAQQFAQSQKMNLAGQLAGGVAHDFNNILTAVIGFSDLLLANHRPSDPSFQDIMNIKQNANRAAGLVRQLLAFSRRQTLRPQVLALNDVLSDLSILLTRLLGENVKLSVNHGRDLWPIKADLNQFETVIINLAVNGRDAMPGGGTMTIRTRNLRAEEAASFAYHPLPTADYVLIEVEDTGTGMTAEVQAKIFEPFFSTKEVGKGTGLGLSTVYGIVKQTGAHIFFSSDLGQGTVFRIFMPRYIPAEGEKPAGPVAENNTDIADLTGTATILLVEDEEAVRAFAARALQSRGYKVHEAASGVEALAVMEKAGGNVDLVVSDVVMPELDGPSLLRELRKTRPELKIIFISGYAEDAFRKNLPEGETFHFLPKPFSLKQLAIAVKETLGK